MGLEKSGKGGEVPLRAAWINLLPEILKIAKIASKAVSLQKEFTTKYLGNSELLEILCKNGPPDPWGTIIVIL